MLDVSFLIPARCEIYLENTVRDILKNIRGNSEILVYLDGWKPDPPFDVKDDRVIFYHTEHSIGQRGAINYLAGKAQGKYICKLDAHCAIDEGFDIKMMEDCEYDWTVIPRMYNLDVETWKPKLIDNWNEAVRKGKVHDYIMMGQDGEDKLRTLYYPHRVNKILHHSKKDVLIDDTMSCMGPGFFMMKDRFWELGGCDENHGSWGQQGIEVACKAWLSGGSLKVNKKTWFAHYFRGGSGPGWPYPISNKQVHQAKRYSEDLWLNDKWPLAKRKFQWLLDKFNPPGWNLNSEKKLDPSIDLTVIFLTMNKLPKKWSDFQIKHLKEAVGNFPVISVSREPMDFGTNIVDKDPPSYWNLYMKILDAAKLAKTPYIAIAEDDTLYTREHFTEFRPPMNKVSYDRSRWSLFSWDNMYCMRQRISNCSCIAPRQLLIDSLNELKEKYPNGCDYKLLGEIGRRRVTKRLGITPRECEEWFSSNPIVQLNHPNGNDTGEYGIVNGRHMVKKHGQIKAYDIPYWGKAADILKEYAA